MLVSFLISVAGAFVGMLLFNLFGAMLYVYRVKSQKRKMNSLLDQLKKNPNVKIVSSQEELNDLIMSQNGDDDPSSWN